MQDYCQRNLAGLNAYSPVDWDRIPDFGLYMDQVISFITQMFEPLYGGVEAGYLSPAMINNYVKAKLIPRPQGKKYSREQIALLTMIVALKQVCTMEDIRVMFAETESLGVQRLYTRFFECHTQSLQALLDDAVAEDDLSPALQYAIGASALRSGCSFMLKAKD